MGHWRQVVQEQLALLTTQDVHLHVAINGMEDTRPYLDKWGGAYTIVSQQPDLRQYEFPGILHVETLAADLAPEDCILYYHTKGTSHGAGSDKRTWWRHVMDALLIDGYEWAWQYMQAHPECDAIGYNWLDIPRVPHFSGNYWLARVRHLRRLKPFAAYLKAPRHRIYDSSDIRLCAEYWIGIYDWRGDTRYPEICSLHHRNAVWQRVDFDAEFKNIKKAQIDDTLVSHRLRGSLR
jgi:hypothetical protein